MIELVFVKHSGTTHVVEARPGQSVMRAATGANVSGILAECGGCATCMTCHCFVEPDRLPKLPQPGAIEAELLQLLLEARPNSRLTCQIVVTASMKGMRFDIPEWQGQSIRCGQASLGCQFRPALSSAFARTTSFRMTATMATFGGFPAATIA